MLVVGHVLSVRYSMSVWLLSGGVCIGQYCFLFLDIAVGPGVRSILDIDDPWSDALATVGDCFVCWGKSECLGVEWFFFWD